MGIRAAPRDLKIRGFDRDLSPRFRANFPIVADDHRARYRESFEIPFPREV